MRILLINATSLHVEQQFDAVDITDARTQAVAFCKQINSKIIVAQALRTMTPTQPVPPPTVDDQVIP